MANIKLGPVSLTTYDVDDEPLKVEAYMKFQTSVNSLHYLEIVGERKKRIYH